jgi:hypothetical protein
MDCEQCGYVHDPEGPPHSCIRELKQMIVFQNQMIEKALSKCPFFITYIEDLNEKVDKIDSLERNA